jgi:hypothetical protein
MLKNRHFVLFSAVAESPTPLKKTKVVFKTKENCVIWPIFRRCRRQRCLLSINFALNIICAACLG